MKAELKRGDRVRYIGSFGELRGKVGTILSTNWSLNKDRPDAVVSWDYSGRTGYPYKEDLELVDNGLDIMLRESFGS